jgi:ferrous iron transport protein B
MKIALVGNPNSGKTTIFNALTKLNQKIGNWPGVTVEKKEGVYFRDKTVSIIDLPGVYSLNPLSSDEIITNNYLMNKNADAIINVVDATNLERGLGLTIQLLEKGLPVVLALNMSDELKINGIELNIGAIERDLGLPVVAVSGRKKAGLVEAVEAAISLLALRNSHSASRNRCHSVEAPCSNSPRAAQGNSDIHGFIATHIDGWRTRGVSRARAWTDKIDRVLLNRWAAFPIFAFVIWFMYFMSVQVVGGILTEHIEYLFFDLIGENLRAGLLDIGSPNWVASLCVDGIIAGVGAVLTFLPQIFMLFLFITFLEGCGYMSRVAVIMDRLFKKIGLSGKSFIPLVIGCGCSVPAILGAKTIENDRERKATIMLVPFIPCSAKLPVFALIAGALFPHNSFVAPSMYFLGILMVILGALFLKLFRPQTQCDNSFIVEIPRYRLPNAKNMAMEIWQKVRGFVIRAGTVIVVASILLWFLQGFNFKMQQVEIEDSMLCKLGRGAAWIFAPLGFGEWQAAVAAISGIIGREIVVATFGVLLGAENLNAGLAELFTQQAAYAFMAFILLAAPCIAAMSVTFKELGSKRLGALAILFQCGVAYLIALCINQFGNFWAYHRAACIGTIAVLILIAAGGCYARYFLRRKKSRAGCAGCSHCGECGKTGQ